MSLVPEKKTKKKAKKPELCKSLPGDPPCTELIYFSGSYKVIYPLCRKHAMKKLGQHVIAQRQHGAESRDIARAINATDHKKTVYIEKRRED